MRQLRRRVINMIEIEKPRIECIENQSDESYGKFIV